MKGNSCKPALLNLPIPLALLAKDNKRKIKKSTETVYGPEGDVGETSFVDYPRCIAISTHEAN